MNKAPDIRKFHISETKSPSYDKQKDGSLLDQGKGVVSFTANERPLYRRPRRVSPDPSVASPQIALQSGPVLDQPRNRGNHRTNVGSEYELDTWNSMKLPPQRRNLQVRVVDIEKAAVEPQSTVKANRLPKSIGLMSNDNHSRRPSLAPLLKHQSDSTASLQSVGRDFSRYPSRQPSRQLLDPSSLSNAGPSGIPRGGEYSIPSSLDSKDDSGFDGQDPERGFSPYIERRGGPVRFPTIDEREDDDPLHNPDPAENEKPVRLSLSNCNSRAFLTVFFLTLFICGLLVLFIVWPVLSYSGIARKHDTLPSFEELSNRTYPLLKAVRSSLVDPDTPSSARTRDSVLGKGKLKLVFSDEFNKDGRSFYPKEDPFWTAADFYYAATEDIEWYDPDSVTTKDGTLRLEIKAAPDHGLTYRSGMLQSWNQLCFKGGVMEVSASLPEPAGVPGLWPGIWTLGNLARPGYEATSNGVWPYSYDQCDSGITPNQSSYDGISYLPGQRLANCVCAGEDHPSPGTGRGAPEIDALEAAAQYDMRVGVVTQSSQVAPFDIWYQANAEFMAIKDYSITQMNQWSGGPYQQAISGVTMLNNSWYGGNLFQKYAFEYIPGQENGQVAWFVGDDETFRMTGNAVGPNGNIGQRDVSREPMSIILNLGFSTSWTWIDWATLGPYLTQGTTMYIDYVRIYQPEGEETVTCDPPGYPTTEYIQNHPKAYQDVNVTSWDDTGYPWPKNKLMNDC